MSKIRIEGIVRVSGFSGYAVDSGNGRIVLPVNPELQKGQLVPFSGNALSFDVFTLRTVNQVGAVYGLFKPAPFRPGFFTCLYVGQTNDLRARIHEHYNNPPIAGVTHFFAEVITTELQRKLREMQLIAEFNPPGNKTRGG